MQMRHYSGGSSSSHSTCTSDGVSSFPELFVTQLLPDESCVNMYRGLSEANLMRLPTPLHLAMPRCSF